ncbi:MAG: UPF0280 family protein [bacterium]
MIENAGHFYRTDARSKNSFTVTYKNANIFVTSDGELREEIKNLLPEIYDTVEKYIALNPPFGKSFVPLEKDEDAPEIIKRMFDAADAAKTGPMASVAGAIAEALFRRVEKKFRTLIIENGGDIFLTSDSALTCGLYSGTGFDNFGIRIKKEFMPCGISSSSSKIGRSVSFGKSALATVISRNGAAADAFATMLANKIHSEAALKNAVNECAAQKNVIGCAGIFEDKIAFAGDIEFLKT